MKKRHGLLGDSQFRDDVETNCSIKAKSLLSLRVHDAQPFTEQLSQSQLDKLLYGKRDSKSTFPTKRMPLGTQSMEKMMPEPFQLNQELPYVYKTSSKANSKNYKVKTI